MRPDGVPRTAGRTVAVVVTWQRLALLREALAAVRAQTRPPDAVVVVDNASTDGTAAFVAAEHPDADLLRLSRNTGGAGGFAAGIARALEAHAADHVWLLDDDTVPDPTALAALLRAWELHPDEPPAVVASRVRWTDGRPHPMNTPRPAPLARRRRVRAAAQVGCTSVRTASFVSILVDATQVRRVGLPVADYFLWNDDFEYTARLLRRRPGLLCPASTVEHRTRTFGSTDVDPGARFYYEVRNKLWVFTRSPGLSPLERAVYAGATLRRWSRTLRRSPDRAVLRRAAVRGLRDGVRSGPRPTSDVLAEALPDGG